MGSALKHTFPFIVGVALEGGGGEFVVAENRAAVNDGGFVAAIDGDEEEVDVSDRLMEDGTRGG